MFKLRGSRGEANWTSCFEDEHRGEESAFNREKGMMAVAADNEYVEGRLSAEEGMPGTNERPAVNTFASNRLIGPALLEPPKPNLCTKFDKSVGLNAVI